MMVDICKCKGGSCPKKEQCYRYTALSDAIAQSYFMKPPWNEEKQECKYFYAIKPWNAESEEQK